MSRGREREDYGPASAGVRNKVSVLVRNIPINFTAEDLRAKFEVFGELRDVYIPRDYYTQRSRGFGFIEFRDSRDADEAIYRMDRTLVDGREINVCLSKEGRKTPREMMVLETKQPSSGRSGSHGGSDYDRRDRRRSRSPRRGSRHSRSRSRSPRRYSRSRSPRGRGGRDYERDRDRDYDRDYYRGSRGGVDDRDRDYDYPRSRSPHGHRDRGREASSRGGREPQRDPQRDRSPHMDREVSPRRDWEGSPRAALKPEPQFDDAALPTAHDYY